MSSSSLKHVAIIPDGNRRWAQKNGLPPLEGHRRGAKQLEEIAKTARELDIEVLTIWGFSTENFKRAQEEQKYLFELYIHSIDRLWNNALSDDVAFHHLGRKDRLPEKLITKLNQLEQKTAHNKKYHLNLALDYGGRDEIIRAVQKLASTGVDLANLTEEQLSLHLDTNQQPDVDLIIRTSGEQRTSGYLPWQASYAEYYFTPLHIPEFTPDHFRSALDDYHRRQRRFGK